MTHRVRCAAVVACLALAVGGCKKGKKTESEPSGKTTEGQVTGQPETPPAETPPPKAKTAAELAAIVQTGWEEFNKRDMVPFFDHYADDATLELVDSGQPVAQGREAVKAVIEGYTTGFPDVKGERVLFLASGNRVVTVDVMSGTNTGEMMGMPATNKKLGMMVLHVFELDDAGKIAKELIYMDQGTMMAQLGVADMPHRAAIEPTGTSATPVVASGSDQEKANLDAVTTADAKMNEGKVDDVLNVMADDIVLSDHTMPADLEGKDSVKAMFSGWIKAFPDFKGETEWSMAAGDYVVRAMKMTGTNKGAMPEMGLKEPTNKPVAMRFVDVLKVEDGKFKRAWTFGNGMAIAVQLGLVEPPAPPKPE